MASVHEQLSGQFYKWEARGRGWQVFEQPVYPEPPFRPFNGHYLPKTPVVDDGRKPTFLSSLFRQISQPPPPPVVAEVEEEPEPTPLVRDALVEFQAALPADLDIARDSFEQFFHSLALCGEPIVFELLGTHKRILAQFAASAEDASLVRRQLQAHFHDVPFRQQEGTLENAWDTSEGDEAFTFEFGLKREFMLPLASGKLDPFIGIIGALAELQPGELGLFQVLWQPVQNPWAESIVNSVTDDTGKPFFVNSPELAQAAENKITRPLYAAVVRILARTATTSRLDEIARDMASSLSVFANPQGNALIPLRNDDYSSFEEHIEDVLRRQSRRSGMILNSDELTGFVHLPSSAVRSPALQRDSGRTKAAPDIVRHPPGAIIGDNEHNGETVPVFLTADQRVRHTHIIGSNGTGKSSLLLNLIRQDIEKGDGIAVLDPHGDLIDQILGFIPAERINDVVLVDLSDEEFPIGFNILHAHSETEKRLLASDLVAVFRRLSTTWGDQMDTVLQNAILAFLKSSRGGTLADLRRFLRDEKFRSEFLLTVRDPEVLMFWQEIFPKLGGGRSVSSLLARLQEFFSQEPLRNMVSQRENNLNFADIMDSGKIFLAKLSAGMGGEENSYLLGTLLISKFQQLAMARQAQKIESRRDFWLYIDEFQHFISPSMEKILSGLRKYRLGFTLAHQNLHQLQDDAKVASAVMTQPCTRIVLRVGDDDAKKLGDGFESFDARSLTRLEKFHAIVRVEQNDFDFNLALRKPELDDYSEDRKMEVIAASRAQYATARFIVEADLLDSLRRNQSKPSPISQPSSTPPIASAQVVSESPKLEEIPKAAVPPILENQPAVVAEVPNITVSEKENVPTATHKPASDAEVPKPTVKIPSASREIEAPKDLGRGGAQHTSIQKRLEIEAQKLGFITGVESQLNKGSNQAADVMLKRGHLEIAVEIAISGTIDHEFENVKKCLDAGFARIAVIATGHKRLEAIAAAVQAGLGSSATAKVSYQTPDEFIAQLQKLAAESELPPPAKPMAATDRHGGMEIERHFPKHSPEEQRLKQQAIFEVTQKAMQP